ncbi:MAG: hypothetical protein PHE17_12340 [Thiothrix sp.]|uniref:hypothetical protein n=1 Tax=Thiothrix sp. TaxID=1032 RepID=UPI0026134AF4|nr:hypothetical protein [Thiothrix sp.]MDD5393799.1 hypothetical protein [Thiothrix sp.]
MKPYCYVAACLLVLAGNALAVSCEVDYKAKRVNKDPRWYGVTERPEFKSGTAQGTGADAKACEKNALDKVQQNNWKVISYKIR